MSLTKDALQHLEASHKTGTEVAEGHALVLGEDFKLADLEAYQDHRRRFRGQFQTEGLSDFTGYVGRRATDETPVFIDRDYMAARCYLDIGTKDLAGHCDHRASLVLPITPEFRAFKKVDGAALDQEGIVELLEDWGHLMSFTNSEGELLEFRQVLNAFRKVSIDDLTSIDSDKQEHSSQVGVMNSVKVKHAERLPAVIEWTLPTYDELDERSLKMRVNTLTPGGPKFRLRALALDAAEKEIAEEFAQRIRDTLPECECLLGTFKP